MYNGFLLLLLLLSLLTFVNGRIRIIGGIEVSDRKIFAHQVSIRYDKEHICGGSILNENYILTASHCVFYSDGSLFDVNILEIVSGDLNLKIPDKNTVVSKVKAIFPHPGYNKKTTENDIAIIELKKNLVINEYVRPININENYDPDISCVVSGWGFTEEGGEKSGVLHFVTVPIIKKPICNEAYEGMIKDGMICAGYMGGGRDACQYDSGGPMMCDDKLAGVVSWGMGCARPGFPGVYTNVTYYRNFIDSILNPDKTKKTKISGQEVKVYSNFAYQVSIKSKGQHICGGSIISENHVLTAARCLYNNGNRIQTEDLALMIGSRSLQEESQIRSVENVIVHERFHSGKSANDIAIVKVFGLFHFSSLVNKIPLATERAKAGDLCTISGWNLNSWDGPRTTYFLRYNKLQVFDGEKCKTFTKTIASLFCAADLRNNESCNGDTGGPLVCNNKLTGIQSFDDGCREDGLPSLYTDVTQYSTWIENNMKQSSSADRVYFNLYLLLIIFILNKA